MNGTAVGTQYMPTRVLQMIDMDSSVVNAEVEEEFINIISLGMTVEIVPTADDSLSIPGEVIHISNLAVEKDGKRIIKVQVKPQDPQWKLKPDTVPMYISRWMNLIGTLIKPVAAVLRT